MLEGANHRAVGLKSVGQPQGERRVVKCSVCLSENEWFATRCGRCGSFLQNKVDTLNLFETLWKLIESPVEAFRKIVLAEHKNYVLVLSGFFGVALVFANLWFHEFGDRFESLLSILSFGVLTGPFVGMGFLCILTGALSIQLRGFRSPMRFKNTFAVSSYACAPIVFSFVLVFPIEIMTFGTELFSSRSFLSSSGATSYVLFLLLDGLAVLWSLFLLSLGVRVMTGFQFLKSAVIALSSAVLTVFPCFLL